MRQIQEIANSDIAQTRALFARHIEKFMSTRKDEHYAASGLAAAVQVAFPWYPGQPSEPLPRRDSQMPQVHW
jgi:hypothetical protein